MSGALSTPPLGHLRPPTDTHQELPPTIVAESVFSVGSTSSRYSVGQSSVSIPLPDHSVKSSTRYHHPHFGVDPVSSRSFYPSSHHFGHSGFGVASSYQSIGSVGHPHPLNSQPSFLLPKKALILGNNNGNMQPDKVRIPRPPPPPQSVFSDITSQYSYLGPHQGLNPSHAPSFKGVDENIYHWKVLNLSRAKLKASSRTSALLSGFAMVAMVEIQIDDNVPEPLLILFVVCTVLLIAVHMLALMISTCILPNVEAVANLHYQTQKTVFESPHMKMNIIVELAWAFSTVIGILLFLVEIAILCWVKFYTIMHSAAWVATGMLIPIMAIFIGFAAHFYLKLVSHKSEVYEDGIKELQLLRAQLEDPEGSPNPQRSPEPGSGLVQIV